MNPANITYGLHQKPPLWVTLLLGLQHVSLISIGLIFPVVVVQAMGGTVKQATFMVAMSMVASGLAVIIQALRKGPVGSGYLCPALCGPSFLSATVLAAQTGGLSLVLGMTLFSGFAEALFSRVLHKLRVLFPVEVTGLIVAMVGMTVIKVAGENFLDVGDVSASHRHAHLAVSLFTLAVMVGLNVWTKGKLKLFCILIGMGLGYACAYALGILTMDDVSVLQNRPMFDFVLLEHPGWSFSWHLAGPFFIAMVCSTLKSVGDLTTCQKINDTDWKRPDMDNISKGILADASGSLIAGMLGGMGQSTSSSNVGLSIATGATSRFIAFATGALLIGLSFCPKLSAVFAIMPKPVIGATLLFSLSFMVVAGFNIVMSRMIDARKTFVIGLSIIVGLMVDIVPQGFTDLPSWLAPVFSSSLSAATVCAVALNMIFRIGIASKATLTLKNFDNFPKEINSFMQTQGATWGARPEIIQRATLAMDEIVEAVLKNGHAPSSGITMDVSFDEYNLNIKLQHEGQALKFPTDSPPPKTLLINPAAASQLAGYLIKHYADKVNTKRSGQMNLVHLHFAH